MAKPRGRARSKAKGRKGGAPAQRKRRPQLSLEEIDWKNYPSLRRFVSERGKIRSRRITGLSRRQQSLVVGGREAGPHDGPAALPGPGPQGPALARSRGRGPRRRRGVRIAEASIIRGDEGRDGRDFNPVGRGDRTPFPGPPATRRGRGPETGPVLASGDAG